MCAQCHKGEGRSRLLARRLSAAGARILPGAVLILLPKCPMCLAAWLTVATGLSVSAAAGDWVTKAITAACAAAIALIAIQFVRKRRFGWLHDRSRGL
jgi:hypothetical protein